tara:strand:- start:182 stop:619 length:438 start_codon:yes stop_codon:yes gene_type:complete
LDSNNISESLLRELVCFNFYRGWRGISEYYRKSLPVGVSAQQSYILELCARDEPVHVTQIANALEIDISAISGMLRRMEKSGLIRRTVEPDNRRQTQVYLTETGEQLRDKVRREMERADAALRELIPQKKINELIDIVDRIRKLR